MHITSRCICSLWKASCLGLDWRTSSRLAVFLRLRHTVLGFIIQVSRIQRVIVVWQQH